MSFTSHCGSVRDRGYLLGSRRASKGGRNKKGLGKHVVDDELNFLEERANCEWIL